METVALKENIKNYPLVAQTPMIHFQPDQTGATLRPSEVKPKLDRFLRKIKGDIPKSWLVSDQHDALNYKMRITRTEERERLNIKDFKLYFANMGDGAMKDLVFADCNLQIICFIPELMKLIDENIGAFFVLHNFGTRQSKGFGGFLVKGFEQPLFVRSTIEQHYPHFFYATVPGKPNAQTRMNHAYAIYTFLKNGINLTRPRFPDRYIKGYAVRAFLPKGVGSDKALMKAKVLPHPVLRPRESNPNYSGYVFIRAMLGLAENYEFRDNLRNDGFKTVINKKTGQPEEKPIGLKVKVTHFAGTEIRDGKLWIPPESIKESKGIQRFRSPVTIKIFQNRIFFILDNSWQNMLGQIFLLSTKKEYDMAANLIKTNPSKAKQDFESFQHIQTPDSFDPDAFISGFVAYFMCEKTKLLEFPERGTGPKPPAGYELREAYGLTLEKGGQN